MNLEKLTKRNEKIKAFLRLQRTRKTIVFLFFLTLSALFWLVISLNRPYETHIEVALQLNNVPQGVIITDDLPATFNVVVNDMGTTLLGYQPIYGIKTINFDFLQFDNGAEHGHVILPREEVIKALQTALAPTTQILAYLPDTLEFYYSRASVSKRVPVRYRGTISSDPLYYLDQIDYQPDSVTVWGDKSMLDTLEYAYTAAVNYTDLTKTTVFTQAMAPIRGAKVVPDQVEITAAIDVCTQQQMEIPIHAINFPAGLTLRTFPSRATVTFHVGMSHYKEITPEQFVLAITYEELLQQQDSILPLTLRSIPEHVSQVRLEPTAVQYMIEEVDVETE